MEMSGLPIALSYAINQVSKTTVSSLKVQPITSTTSGPNQKIVFRVPTTGMLDFKTLRFGFSVEGLDGTGVGNDARGGLRFPAGIKHFFSRVSVKCGGQVILDGNNYFGVQEDAISIVTNNPPDRVTEHGEVVKDYDMMGGMVSGLLKDISGSELYDEGLGKVSAIFSCDLGDICRINPRIVPLDALNGQVEIEITTSGTNCLSAVKGCKLAGSATDSMTESNVNPLSANNSFKISNMTLNMNMYSLDEGAYSMAIARRVKDNGSIEFCYPNHLAFNKAWSGESTFSVSSISLNKLHCLFRRATGDYSYKTIGGCLPVAGGAKEGRETGAQYNWQGAYDASGDVAVGMARFRGRIQHFSCPTSVPGPNAGTDVGEATNYDNNSIKDGFRLQYKINNALVPQSEFNQSEWHDITKWANNVEKLDVDNQLEWLFNKFVCSYPLELPTNKWEPKTISGLNTQGVGTVIQLNTRGNVQVDNTYECLVLAEVTQILRVNADDSMQVIV
tara:strand:+ start:826 stop:2334 length:1509 start_codon:yes stop_codon:yes gene_type:complete